METPAFARATARPRRVLFAASPAFYPAGSLAYRVGCWLVGLVVLLAACKDGGGSAAPGPADAGSDGPGEAGLEAPAGPVDWLSRLEGPADFGRLEGEDWEVKYLAAVAGTKLPEAFASPCTFQNTARFTGHLPFLKTFAEYKDLDFDTYLNLTQKNAGRVFFAGELKLLARSRHPRTGAPGVMVYFVYAAENDPLSAAQLAEMDGRLKACVPYARDLLVLVAMNADQERSFVGMADELASRGVAFGTHAQVRPMAEYEAYSVGEGYGYLRWFRPGQSTAEAGPRDIVIAESASEEVSLVAGLLTTLPQNLHSHLNLRLREKQIPNARSPDLMGDKTLAALDGRLAHLVVTAQSVVLEPAHLADAEAFWQSRRPVSTPLAGNLSETRVQGFAALGAGDRAAYGSKAANLGELYELLPAQSRTEGFAIPFAVGRKFLAESGLLAQIDAFLADPRLATEATFRRAGLKNLRKAIESAPLPPALVESWAPFAMAAFGTGYATLPTRFRSSSNAEDGERASGAGLYDSARGCFADDRDGDEVGPSACLSAGERAALTAELDRRRVEKAAHPERAWLDAIIEDLASDLANERTVARAFKKVLASLWNDRAFEERAYFGLDQRMALMAVAVNSSFVGERLDSVAVTNLVGNGGAPLYRLVSQKDGLPVVRPPDPTLVAETYTFRRGSGDAVSEPRLVLPSSLSPTALWTEAQIAELGRLLFSIQDHFAAKVYPAVRPLSLDLEVKLTQDGRTVIKQVRPFVNVTP